MVNRPSQSEFQRAVMAYGDDGIWDVALGAILLTFGLVTWLFGPPLWAAGVVAVVPAIVVAKRLISAPRLRIYEARPVASAGVVTAVWILLITTLLLIIGSGGLIALSLTRRLSEWSAGILPLVVPILLAVLGVVIMVTTGTMIDAAGRYFFYAAVVAAGFLALLWPAVPGWAGLVVSGGVMLAVGVVVLARFLGTHGRTAARRLSYPFP